MVKKALADRALSMWDGRKIFKEVGTPKTKPRPTTPQKRKFVPFPKAKCHLPQRRITRPFL